MFERVTIGTVPDCATVQTYADHVMIVMPLDPDSKRFRIAESDAMELRIPRDKARALIELLKQAVSEPTGPTTASPDQLR